MRWFFKILKWIFIVIISILLLSFIIIFITRSINVHKSNITTENGIQEDIFVELSQASQYIQIRGEDTKNPIILFLHGGPGSPMSYISYYYRRDLESLYTFVSWDQRGCGRTYFKNIDANSEPSVKILLEDLDELVNYVLSRFQKDKIIIMGHSWGTVLGTLYIKEHPEKVSAYIGVGQCVNVFDGQALATETAMKYAKENNDTKYLNELSSMLEILKETKSFENFDIVNLMTMRRYVAKYLFAKNELPPLKQIWVGITSPYISFEDIKWFLKSDGYKVQAKLMDYLFFEFDLNEMQSFEVPVYFISGDGDWITPCLLVEEYYKTAKAPHKDMIIMKDSGHVPFMDDPKSFNDAIKNILQN